VTDKQLIAVRLPLILSIIMRAAAGIFFSGLLLLTGCQTHQPWICGSALLGDILADEDAQISPYVFCDKKAAELVLTITVRGPNTELRRAVNFYFRAKRVDERLLQRERYQKVSNSGSFRPTSADYVRVEIRGEDLWVGLITQGGIQPVGSAAVFANDFSVSESGYSLEGRWQRKSIER
jgi:hypothetical protein